ncbi:glycine-rich protein [Williamsia sp. SKLECPSW1]
MPRRRRLSTVAALLAAVTATIVTAPAASAAPLPRNCTQALFQSDIRCTFTYTGAPQVFTVPQGLRRVLVEAVGAGGADTGGSGFASTKPGKTFAYAPVFGGQRLFVYVGGNGQHNAPGSRIGAGGYNGGGAGYPNGGGGASDVRTVGGDAMSPQSLASRLVAAPGAGGSAATRGGDGGRPGDSNGLRLGGGAGGPDNGGSPAGDSQPGRLGVGGAASATGGGGGGGGFFGGSGGYRGAGGGGGSPLPFSATTQVAKSGEGARVTIVYDGPCTPFCFGS